MGYKQVRLLAFAGVALRILPCLFVIIDDSILRSTHIGEYDDILIM